MYPRVPKVSAAILADDLEAEPICLVNQPVKGRQPGLRRVSSPFTVETHSPHRYLSIDEALGQTSGDSAKVRDQIHKDVNERIIHALDTQGIRHSDGTKARFQDIAPTEGHHVLTHRARRSRTVFRSRGA